MAYYHASLLLSARHAYNLCHGYILKNTASLTSSEKKLNILHGKQSFTRRKTHYNVVDMDKMAQRHQEIKKLNTAVKTSESVISELKQTAGAMLDIIDLFGKNTRTDYDYANMLKSGQHAVCLFQEKIDFYQGKIADYNIIIKNITAQNNANTASVNTDGLYKNIKFNERRIDELSTDILYMNTIIDIISRQMQLNAEHAR